MSKQKLKNQKATTKGRHIVSTKPTFRYYILMTCFPLMFFLVDNSFDIFKQQWNLDWITLSSVLFLLLCFGVPLILFLSRREIKLFEDRLILRWPSLNITKEYRMENLIKWEYFDFYLPKAGQQKYLHIWFYNSGKISFHGLQSNNFRQLVNYFEKVHIDKKRQRMTLNDILSKWMKNKKYRP